MKQRVQFGVPIGSFQAVKHKAADMYVAIERARALAYFAALTIAEDDPRRGRAARMAKAAGGECQQVVFCNGFQLFGGMGFTWENELQIYVKRAKAGDLLLGTASVHRKALFCMRLTADRRSRSSAATSPPSSTRTAERGAGQAQVAVSSDMPEWAAKWQRTLFDAGWLLPGNRPEYGGRNATLPQQLAYLEELAERRIYQFQPAGPRHHRCLDPDVRDAGAEAAVSGADPAGGDRRVARPRADAAFG